MPELKRTLVAAFAGLLLSLPLLAAGTTDFSGTWELNTDKGQNLGMVKAVDETVVVTQSADKLVIDFTSKFMMKTTKRQVSYDLKGGPVPNEGAMGDKAQTVAKWADGTLVVTWTSEGAVAGSKTVKTETRWLSADGTEMSVETARANKPPMVLVYDKKK
ncbi:MAG: hypothetical protein KJ040_09780 [Gammaproteobacteria bacterium]|nr:hypothetical protein [Gammaproteobacteria bacterium]